jgi:polyferredoxin
MAACSGGTLLPGEVWLLIAGTVAFSLELLFARHLFCRYGCSVGILQSLAWMSNRRALVVGTERSGWPNAPPAWMARAAPAMPSARCA